MLFASAILNLDKVIFDIVFTVKPHTVLTTNWWHEKSLSRAKKSSEKFQYVIGMINMSFCITVCWWVVWRNLVVLTGRELFNLDRSVHVCPSAWGMSVLVSLYVAYNCDMDINECDPMKVTCVVTVGSKLIENDKSFDVLHSGYVQSFLRISVLPLKVTWDQLYLLQLRPFNLHCYTKITVLVVMLMHLTTVMEYWCGLSIETTILPVILSKILGVAYTLIAIFYTLQYV